MRRWAWLMVLGLPLTLGAAEAQPQRQGPPHAWIFGSWTGGQFPPLDTEGPDCFGQPTVVFTRDVVMRSSILDTAYRQRIIETVGATQNGLEFRFVPFAGVSSPVAASRLPPDIGFGCAGNPNLLVVEQRGENEIAFPDCKEFPAVLRRCTTPR